MLDKKWVSKVTYSLTRTSKGKHALFQILSRDIGSELNLLQTQGSQSLEHNVIPCDAILGHRICLNEARLTHPSRSRTNHFPLLYMAGSMGSGVNKATHQSFASHTSMKNSLLDPGSSGLLIANLHFASRAIVKLIFAGIMRAWH